MTAPVERESLSFDVIIVGAGPAGLAAAIRLAQLAREADVERSICVLEKGAEVGAHILSGAVLNPRALDELLPGWQASPPPGLQPVTTDEFHWLRDDRRSLKLPAFAVPASLHNRGDYVISAGRLCQWLAAEAEALGVDVFAGFAASRLLLDDSGAVAGVGTADRGRDRHGAPKAQFEPGMDLFASQTIVAEGARGQLGRELTARYALAAGRDPQHYALGIKELWEVPAAQHDPGRVLHGVGWPLGREAGGGWFLYHAAEGRVAVGLVTDLNYRNPWLSPYAELQRLKHHPLVSRTLAGGERLAYGARAIAKGGFNALSKMSFPGGLLVGCNAGTLNGASIKGLHMAMKSGMLAAETVHDALQAGGAAGATLGGLDAAFAASWAGRELRAARNVGPWLHRGGLLAGGAAVWLEQTLLRGRVPWTLHDREPDHAGLLPAAAAPPIDYPAPDGRLSFDRLSSVFLSGTGHPDDQPVHLELADPALAITRNHAVHAAPESRYCPAGVYEVLTAGGAPRLQINAQNCLHCKACDIKDPGQNITWVAPAEGGPAYTGM